MIPLAQGAKDLQIPASALLVACTVPAVLAAQDTVRFTPTVGHPTFAGREPVLRIKPGTVLISHTMFGLYYTEQGGAFPSYLRHVRARPAETG